MTDSVRAQPNSSLIEISLIKKELLRFTVFVLAATLVVLFSKNKLKELAEQRVKLSLSISQGQIQLRDRLEKMTAYTAINSEFSRLYDADARVDKLRWIEHLEFQSKMLKLPSLSYSIKTKSAINADSVQSFVAFSTPISIKVDLTHEGQLLDLLKATQNAKLGLFSVDQCIIAIKSPSLSFSPNADNLQAECTINWLTVARPLSEPEL